MENNALQADYSNWEAGKNYPEWMDEISLATVSKGYLLPGEDVKKAYRRVAKASAYRLKRPDLENKFTPSVNAEKIASDLALSCQLGVPS